MIEIKVNKDTLEEIYGLLQEALTCHQEKREETVIREVTRAKAKVENILQGADNDNNWQYILEDFEDINPEQVQRDYIAGWNYAQTGCGYPGPERCDNGAFIRGWENGQLGWDLPPGTEEAAQQQKVKTPEGESTITIEAKGEI